MRFSTSGDYAKKADKLRAKYKEEAEKRKQESGKVHGRGKEKVRERIPGSIAEKRARDELGKKFGVSGRMISKADYVCPAGEEDVRRCGEGEAEAIRGARQKRSGQLFGP